MWLILCYTVQLVIPDVCTKFQNPKSSSFREIFDGKKSLQTNIVTEKAKTIYPLYTSYAGGIIIQDLLVQGGGEHTLNSKKVMPLFNWRFICLITCFYDAHVQYDKN